MLTKAEQRLSGEPDEVRRRLRLVQAPGEQAEEATGGRRFTAVLCHGVLMYLQQPDPLVRALCRCTQPGGIVSVMALNARTLAVRPALDRRWADALAAFDATGEVGVAGHRHPRRHRRGTIRPARGERGGPGGVVRRVAVR